MSENKANALANKVLAKKKKQKNALHVQPKPHSGLFAGGYTPTGKSSENV